jgi:hypothetical protein
MQFFDGAEIGSKQTILRDGSLLCRDVVIGRTGVQRYYAGELGLPGDHFIDVERPASEVFAPQSMASFEGAPVTLEHPVMPVTRSNMDSLSVGVARNIRKHGGLLIADLVIRARRAIDAIRQLRWRGVSCGYDAEYATGMAGRMRQYRIVGNHVALLPPDVAPRCGELCFIGDASSGRGTVKKPSRDRYGYYVSGNIPAGVAGSLVNVGGLAGPKRVMQLDPPATQYDVITETGGECWLVKHAPITGIGDPGTVSKGSGSSTTTMFGDRSATLARYAMEDATRAKMATISAAHRAYWKQ